MQTRISLGRYSSRGWYTCHFVRLGQVHPTFRGATHVPLLRWYSVAICRHSHKFRRSEPSAFAYFVIPSFLVESTLSFLDGWVYLQDVESYPSKGLLTDGQDTEGTLGTGSYGYDQSQVGIVGGLRAPII